MKYDYFNSVSNIIVSTTTAIIKGVAYIVY